VDLTGIEPATSCLQSVIWGIGAAHYGELPSAIGLVFLRASVPWACVRHRYGVRPIVAELCTKL
jgi:hypothetical protein